MTLACRIQVMAKAPVAGLAKTRLIPALGAAGAAALQERFIRHTLHTATRTGLPTELWCHPAIDHPCFAACARKFGVVLHPQRGTELGARMRHALDHGLGAGEAVILIGTDCPDLDAADLRAARDALAAGYDAVLGPALDGGYYLIGLRRPAPTLFDAMPWGSAEVLAETRARAHAAGLRWLELPPRHDIDTPADLAYLSRDLLQVPT